MIIVQIKGGLGNQMFRYALGRHLAILNNTSVALDINDYRKNKYHNQPKKGRVRKFDLRCFQIPFYFLDEKEVERILNPPFSLFKKQQPAKVIEEQAFHYDSSVLRYYDHHLYLKGAWQSEKYFKESDCVIRKDFAFREQPSGKNKEYISRMNEEDSIAIHVRRADYVKDQVASEKHGTCGVEYYQRAIAHMRECLPNPSIYVFSDDDQWVRENLNFDMPTHFVDHNTEPDAHYEDMRLMSHCKHQVIANSTFSWWGAWLNENPDKIVIAPQRWFRDTSIDDSDLIPESWVPL